MDGPAGRAVWRGIASNGGAMWALSRWPDSPSLVLEYTSIHANTVIPAASVVGVPETSGHGSQVENKMTAGMERPGRNRGPICTPLHDAVNGRRGRPSKTLTEGANTAHEHSSYEIYHFRGLSLCAVAAIFAILAISASTASSGSGSYLFRVRDISWPQSRRRHELSSSVCGTARCLSRSFRRLSRGPGGPPAPPSRPRARRGTAKAAEGLPERMPPAERF
ncbi:hypothetical protein GQ53DRAFT_86882 [Thozetella sp. PMI_491]|nr:hypothetical protein GQ53DRAFT_86882 [Thozetella sp. PMI_491]